MSRVPEVIRIHLDEATLARTRIAVSPLHEVTSSLELLHRQPERAPWPYTEWAATAAGILRTTPATGPLQLYGELHGQRHAQRTPDLFNLIPESPFPSLAEQLATVRSIPQDLVDEQFSTHYPAGVPGFLQPYQQDRVRAFARLADALRIFWDLAVAPYWPAMRAALEEEVLLRARALAAEGPSALLGNLRGHLVWEPPVLSIGRRKAESTLLAVDQRLLLVPLIFAQEMVTVSTDHPEIVMVSYQARGEAVLAPGSAAGAADAGGGPDDRLGSLIGPGRAKVLRALVQPSTTTGLATALGLAPSTVSEQLAALQAAGVVHRRRSGRRVFYGLEPAGVALLSLLESGGSPG